MERAEATKQSAPPMQEMQKMTKAVGNRRFVSTSIAQCLLARLRGSAFTFGLDVVGADDGGDQARKAGIDFRTARRILHFHSLALTANQTGVPQYLEVLRQGRFRNALLADLEETGTILRASGGGDLGKDRHAHRIRQRVQDPLDSDVLDRRVE